MAVKLDIITPEKALVSREADMVIIPAFNGDMGILPGHSPVVTLLRGGVISVYVKGVAEERYFVEDGFATVTAESCSVLVKEVKPVAELSLEEAEARLAQAGKEYSELNASGTKEGVVKALDNIQKAAAEVYAASKGKPTA